MQTQRRHFLKSAATLSSVPLFLASKNAIAGTIVAGVRAVPTFINVKSYGALGNADTTGSDDTDAIQSAINACGPAGGTLYFPKGIYGVRASSLASPENSCLLFKNPIRILGDGPFYSAILPLPSVAATTQIMVFSPDQNYPEDKAFTTIEGIFIGNPNAGARNGNQGVFCRTLLKGQQLAKFTMRDVYIQQGNGRAFYHSNDTSQNGNGGLYAALIENCFLQGGVMLSQSGDSIVIRNCIITGNQIGIEASLVSHLVNGSPDTASLLSIIDNNITSSAGAIKIYAGSRYNIIRNNIENSNGNALSSNDGAVINISGANGVMYGGVIECNLVSAFGETTANCLVRLRNARGLSIENNVLNSDHPAMNAISVGPDCVDVAIGRQTYNAGTTTNKIQDSGQGTMGVSKALAPLNSWVPFYSNIYGSLSCRKTREGLVYLSGALKLPDGQSAPSSGTTVMFNLPLGFRPLKAGYFPVCCNSSGLTMGTILIDPGGAVVFYAGSAGLMSFNGVVFPSATFGDGYSDE